MMQAADDDAFSFQAFSLDMTIFESKGNRYCIWAEKVGVGRQISNLYIAKMQSPDLIFKNRFPFFIPLYLQHHRVSVRYIKRISGQLFFLLYLGRKSRGWKTDFQFVYSQNAVTG